MLRVSLVGQTLDEKYKIERELGKGGMGAVYLATHLGTERAVAVKVIAPEFMQRAEFVERFRREARAAGRLRHPNVVDVTDFGIAETKWGHMAYLVMEYLDGCTLGEVLEEEKNLPLSWTLDILEQTCAAVEEAHRQGIIHRDLKPDNIWLEPNASGGYTVKVLDFGIAKLETPMQSDEIPEAHTAKQAVQESDVVSTSENQTLAFSDKINSEQATLHLKSENPQSNAQLQETLALPPGHNQSSESATIAQKPAEIADEGSTALFPAARATAAAELNENVLHSQANKAQTNNQDDAQTKILAAATATSSHLNVDRAATTAALTHVGAVLGTPLYMSPEQCRGERLDARADIYALGIIAYQMLAGAPPFTGNYTEVMEAHKETAAPPLEAKKVGRKVKKVIASTLAKNPDERPANATALASKLRSNSEGVGALLRRSLVIWSEHSPTFLWLAFLSMLPIFLLSVLSISVRFYDFFGSSSSLVLNLVSALIGLIGSFVAIFSSSILLGLSTFLVAQLLAAPLRPVNLRPAQLLLRRKWRSFAGTVTVSTILPLFGSVLCLIPGVILFVRYHLVAPVIMMEEVTGRAALKRSGQLVKRSLATVIAAIFLQYFVPILTAAFLGFFVSALLKSNEIFVTERDQNGVHIRLKDDNDPPPAKTDAQQAAQENIKTAPVDSEAEKDKAAGKLQVTVGSTVVYENDTDAELGQSKKNAAGNEQSAQSANDDKSPDHNIKTEQGKARSKKKGLIPMLSEILFQIIFFPVSVVISSLTSIITALLYFKTRQAGGESLEDLLAQFEITDHREQKNWQLRLKNKLQHSARHQSRNA